MARIIMPLPARDFDPTEAAVSWQVLTGLGHRVSFATPDGCEAAADDLMLSGEGLDPWGFVPVLRKLKLVGLVLRADARGRAAYREMAKSAAYVSPITWDQANAADFDALLLPGGHRARGMRTYLESGVLQALTVAFFTAGKPVGAICHGVLLAARSVDPATGRSVLYGRRTTALTWALERTASHLARVTRFWDPAYYRTYADAPGQAEGYMSVQQEVTRALARPEDFLDVPRGDPHFRARTGGMVRDTATSSAAAFVVTDGNYVSARWPGDAHSFAASFGALLGE